MIANEYLDRLIRASQLGLLVRAVKNGLAFSRMTGGSLMATLGGAWKMYRSGDLSFGQTLMAANSPMMIQEAMVKGNPHDGILPSGQVAGLIDDLPTVAELVAPSCRMQKQLPVRYRPRFAQPQTQIKDRFMAFSSSVDAGIAEVVFNKPPVNAFNSAEWAGIAAEIKALGSRATSTSLSFAQRVKGFCAGVDIKELGADPNMIVPVNKGNYDTFEAIHRNPKPVIVALHGFVLGEV